jgi:hypothetical protein
MDPTATWTMIGAAGLIVSLVFTAIWRASAANLKIDILREDVTELKRRMTKKEDEIIELSKETAVLQAFAEGVRSVERERTELVRREKSDHNNDRR